MIKTFIYRFIPLLSVVCLVIALSVPVSAEMVKGAYVVDLDQPERFYKDNNTVVCTYDIPLSPYSIIYGYKEKIFEWNKIGSTTNIYFTQNKGESLLVFTPLAACEVRASAPSSSGSGYYSTPVTMSPLVFDAEAVTHMMINNVAYPVTPVVGTNGEVRFDTYPTGSNYAGRYVLYRDTAASGWFFLSQKLMNARVQLGYYEEIVITEGDYDGLLIAAYPLGFNQDTQRGNVIKVSDLRSGSNFNVDLTLDTNILLADATPSFEIKYITYFYDKYGNELEHETDVVDVDPFTGSKDLHYGLTFTVPDGAAYFDISFETGYINVEDVVLLDWRMISMQISVDVSSVESNSQMMEGIQDKLDEISEQLRPTPEQSDKAEQLEQGISGSVDKIENNSNILDSLTPTMPHINTDLNLDGPTLSAVTPLVANIWSIGGMIKAIGIVITVATVAYIFFGKRGS